MHAEKRASFSTESDFRPTPCIKNRSEKTNQAIILNLSLYVTLFNAFQGLNAKLESETAALRADVQIKDAELQDLKRQFAELKTLVHGLVQANGGAR